MLIQKYPSINTEPPFSNCDPLSQSQQLLAFEDMTDKYLIINCPNCGCKAIRRYFHKNNSPVIQTECDRCDYFLQMGIEGNVLEFYAPNMSLTQLKR